MHGTVQIRDLFNFFLCCCLSKGTIFHRFLMFVLFTSFYHSGYFGVACVIYLRDCEAQHCSPKPWLGIAIRQVNYNQPPQVKNLNNTKKGKFGIPSRKIPKSRKCPPVQALSVGSPYTVLSPAAQCQNFSVGSPYTASSSSRVSWLIRKEQII